MSFKVSLFCIFLIFLPPVLHAEGNTCCWDDYYKHPTYDPSCKDPLPEEKCLEADKIVCCNLGGEYNLQSASSCCGAFTGDGYETDIGKCKGNEGNSSPVCCKTAEGTERVSVEECLKRGGAGDYLDEECKTVKIPKPPVVKLSPAGGFNSVASTAEESCAKWKEDHKNPPKKEVPKPPTTKPNKK